MVFKRIMPCLLYNGKNLIKTVKFKSPNYVGDPINAVKIYNEKEVDELVFLDICAYRDGREPDFRMIAEVASECFMPLSYGGGVLTLEHFHKLFQQHIWLEHLGLIFSSGFRLMAVHLLCSIVSLPSNLITTRPGNYTVMRAFARMWLMISVL